MRAEGWQAVAYGVLATAAVAGGIWGLFTFRKSRRTDAARWVTDIFNTFYKDPAFLAARDLYEYEYWSSIRHSVELRVNDRHVVLTSGQRESIRAVDLILNFLEQLLYLESEDHIATRDREVFFAYWFGILGYPSRAGLRRYLASCGYERCSLYVGCQAGEVIAGSIPIGQWEGLTPLEGGVLLPFEHGMPDGSFVASTGLIPEHSQAFRVTDPVAFRRLDDHFGYDPAAAAKSPLRRLCVPSTSGTDTAGLDVWVYLDENSADLLPALLPEAGGSYRRV
jgi:hypothetical protein